MLDYNCMCIHSSIHTVKNLSGMTCFMCMSFFIVCLNTYMAFSAFFYSRLYLALCQALCLFKVVCMYVDSLTSSCVLCLQSAIVSSGAPSLVRNAGGGHRCPLLIMLNGLGQYGQHSGTLEDQRGEGGASCQIPQT